MNPQIVVDLNKVQWCRFGYVNDFNHWRDHKPTLPTYCNNAIPEGTVNKFNKRFDTWIPKIILNISANRTLSFTGKKATSLWSAWREKIFNK